MGKLARGRHSQLNLIVALGLAFRVRARARVSCIQLETKPNYNKKSSIIIFINVQFKGLMGYINPVRALSGFTIDYPCHYDYEININLDVAK